MDDRGFIVVDEHLQVPGCRDIYAAGDIITGSEEKLAQAAQKQSAVVVSNILRTHNLTGSMPLKRHSTSDYPIVISLGKYDAIFTWKNWTFTGFLPALAKEVVEFKVMITY